MFSRTAFLAVLGLALAGCSTVATVAGDPLSARWVGQGAGKFFAAYGPPVSDEPGASTTTYVWKGGYSSRREPARYSGEGKSRKLVAPFKDALDSTRAYFLVVQPSARVRPAVRALEGWLIEQAQAG